MARSGRWRGPYTVKKRNAMNRMPYRWLYTCPSSSPDTFVLAYGLIGWSTWSLSRHGVFGFTPYTLLDEANTTCGVPDWRASSRMFWVPATLTSWYVRGSAIDGRTPGRAARCA